MQNLPNNSCVASAYFYDAATGRQMASCDV